MLDNTPTDAAGFILASPGAVQSTLREESGSGNRSTPPSGGRDNEEAETFVAGVITEPSPGVTEASQGRHVAVETVQLSKKRKRPTDKRPSKKAATPAADGKEATKKKGAMVSQTLEGFRKVIVTNAVATGHLRHIRDHYGVEIVVKVKIPLAGETIDAPLVDPTAGRGDPMVEGYTPICWEFMNYGIRLPASTFINSVLTAIDRAPGQLGPFAWASLTAFQVVCLSVGVVPSLNLFSRIFNVAHTGALLHFHTRSGVRNMLYHGKPWKASPTRWHKYWFLTKDAFSDEGLKKLEEGFPQTLALDVFCDPDVIVKAGLSKGVNNFPNTVLATLLGMKEGKPVVPQQVSYLDVISWNRLLSDMLSPEVPSSSAALLSTANVSNQTRGTEEKSSPLLPTPSDQPIINLKALSPELSPIGEVRPSLDHSYRVPSWNVTE
ncbi:hypothetical protein LIER_38386 [Lithospermum erythrorhizon]|uniref:Transposase (putative) gypsy type domain-containing protein n=1 Tax=Lithospermum erythrorhizon TaxID=34254 RepID=A0AAV3Q150_LITER